MTWFHWAQVALALGIGVMIVRRLRRVMYGTSVDATPFVTGIRKALADGDVERAADLAAGAKPAWIGEVARVGLSAAADGADVGRALDEPITEMRFEIERLRTLKRLARIATAIGILGAVIEMMMLVLSDERGLEGLVAGLAERRATEASVLSLAIGVTTSLVALLSMSSLGKPAALAMKEGLRLAELLEQNLSAEEGSDP